MVVVVRPPNYYMNCIACYRNISMYLPAPLVSSCSGLTSSRGTRCPWIRTMPSLKLVILSSGSSRYGA